MAEVKGAVLKEALRLFEELCNAPWQDISVADVKENLVREEYNKPKPEHPKYKKCGAKNRTH